MYVYTFVYSHQYGCDSLAFKTKESRDNAIRVLIEEAAEEWGVDWEEIDYTPNELLDFTDGREWIEIFDLKVED